MAKLIRGLLGIAVIAVAAVAAFAALPELQSWLAPEEAPTDEFPQPASTRDEGEGSPPATHLDLEVRQTQPPQVSTALRVTVRAALELALTNHGTADAHDVRVAARARVGDDYISVNDQEIFSIDFGTVNAKETIREEVALELRMSLLQGRRAEEEGITFETVIVSADDVRAMPAVNCNAVRCAEV